jgi:hypothetical protein
VLADGRGAEVFVSLFLKEDLSLVCIKDMRFYYHKAVEKVKVFAVLVVAIFLSFFMMSGTIWAWDDCVKGMVDDPYPGECARYIDTDDDGICDHSQLAPEDREMNDQKIEVADMKTSSLQQVDSASKEKFLLAGGIVIVNMIGILAYVTYKKSR